MCEVDIGNAILLGVQYLVGTACLKAIHFDAVIVCCCD